MADLCLCAGGVSTLTVPPLPGLTMPPLPGPLSISTVVMAVPHSKVAKYLYVADSGSHTLNKFVLGGVCRCAVYIFTGDFLCYVPDSV